VVVFVVVIAVTAILLAGLVVLVGRPGVGDEHTTRLPAALLPVAAAPSRLLTSRRLAWRGRVRTEHAEEATPSSPGPGSSMRARRRRRGPSLEDPAEVERLVREQLYGRLGQRG
jgi:hypothetical protein